MKIAICEDEYTQAKYLSDLIYLWQKESKVELSVDIYGSAEHFLFSEFLNYDLLILDIQMDEMDGITLAKKVRKNNSIVKIIFVTGIPDFMSEGYEVEALHYLIKPVNEEKFFTLLDKAKISQPEKFIVVLQRKILLKDLFYLESMGHKLKIKLKNEEIFITEKIQNLLDYTDTILCHRSYAVNISRVKCITKTDIILDNDEKIPVSRRLHKDICSAFTKYFGEKI